MVRLISAVLVTIVVVVFSMVNTHQVPMSLVFGPPFQAPLIFMLMVAYLAGLLTAFLYSLFHGAKEERARKLKSEEAKRAAGVPVVRP